jgi:NitT/TauT family transport system permease protein
VLAELYVSTTGIGYFTQTFSERFDPADLFGLITVLATIAIVLNEVARRLELHFSRWRSD